MNYILTHAVPWQGDPVEVAIWKVDEPRGRVSLVKRLLGKSTRDDVGASLDWARKYSIAISDSVDKLIEEATFFTLNKE